MRALLAKEAREVAPFALVAIATALWVRMHDVDSALLAPPDGRGLAGLVGVVFGLTAGFAIFHCEDTRDTEAYLLHRGLARGQVFLAKVAAGLGATLAVATLPPLLFALWMTATSPLAPILQWERVGELAAAGTVGLEMFAVGAFASRLQRGSGDVAFWFLGALGLGTAAYFAVGALPLSWAVAVLLTHAALAMAVLAATWLLVRTPVDRDLSYEGPLGVTLLALSFVLLVVPMVVLGRGTSLLARDILHESYPAVWLDDSGRYYAGSRFQQTGRPVIVETGLGSTDTYYEDVHRRIFDPATLDAGRARGPWEWLLVDGAFPYELPDGSRLHAPVYLDRHLGSLHLFRFPARVPGRFFKVRWRSDVPRRELLVVEAIRPDGRRFSAGTTHLKGRLGEVEWPLPLLVDPGDGTLWSVDVRRPEDPLERVLLPNGDVLVGLDQLVSEEALRTGMQRTSGRQVVRGRAGTYRWTGAELVPPDADPRFAFFRPESEVRDAGVVTTVVDDDPVHPRVEVVDRDAGELLFAHRYAPRSAGQRVVTVVLYVAALAGLPCVSVPSFLGADWDVLFAGGRRPGLLAAQLALVATLALSALRRSRRERAAGPTLALGVAWVLAFGLPGFVAVRLLRPRPHVSMRSPSSSHEAKSDLVPVPVGGAA